MWSVLYTEAVEYVLEQWCMLECSSVANPIPTEVETAVLVNSIAYCVESSRFIYSSPSNTYLTVFLLQGSMKI